MMFPRYPNYKASGFTWLGDVPEHWQLKRLGHYFDERRERASDTEFEPLSVTKLGIVPRLESAAKTQDGDNRKKVLAGDFVINSRSDRKGSSGLSPLDGSVSLICTVLIPAGLHGPYIHHLFRSELFQEEYYRWGKGIVADLWSTNFSDMKNIVLGVPSEEEQAQIARFLDHETTRIDALIEEQQRLIELLKEKRQAVISHAVTKGLDPTVPMKDSGVEWLGEVPAHWRAVRLRHCLVDALTYGANEPSDEANLEHPRYIRITDLNDDGTLSAETYKSLPPDKAEPYMLEQGDVLFARSGATVGKSFLYSRDYGPACYAGYLIRARVNKRALIPMYLWMCTQSRQYEQFIGESNIQATIQNVSAEKYGNMWIALPEIEEQEKILAELETQLSLFKSLVETSVGALVLLQERRSALISAAVTGKIDVRDWQPPASTQAPKLDVAEAH